jgi:hypothetical protein
MFGVGVGVRVGGRTIVSSGGGFDPDAQAFFDRVTASGGTLSDTEKTATNQLVLDMKSASIWTSMKAIYPMVGASAAACAQNLKSSSFTGTFSSGWTFASTGVTPNGTSAYMDTGINANTQLTTNNTHLSGYSRTNQYPYSGVPAQMVMGCSSATYQPLFDLELNGGTGSNNTFGTYMNDYTTGFIRVANTDTRGFLLGNRPASNSLNLWRNGTKIGSNTSTTSLPLPSFNLVISALNNGGSFNNFSNAQTSFNSIGDGLADTQASDFYTAVQAFQTTLSRNV